MTINRMRTTRRRSRRQKQRRQHGGNADQDMWDGITQNDAEKLKRALLNGANPNALNSTSDTPLSVAIGIQNPQSIKLLLEFGAEKGDSLTLVNNIPNATIRKSILLVLNTTILLTPLHKLVYSDESEDILVEKAKELLDAGQELDQGGGPRGDTAMIFALRHRKFKLVTFLLDRGSNPNAQNDNASFPLLFASQYGQLDLVKRFHEEFGQDLEYSSPNNGVTALMYSVLYNKLDVLKYLISKGANVNHISNNKRTALSIAFSYDENEEIVKYLLDHGADPNISLFPMQYNNKEYTIPVALYLFTSNKLHLLRLFLEHGQDPNVISKDYMGKSISLLEHAIQFNNPDILNQLIDAGGNANQMLDGRSLLKFSIQYNTLNCLKLLVERGADVNSQDGPAKATALHVAIVKYASVQQSKEILLSCIQFLVAAGTDLSLRDIDGQTPGDLSPDITIDRVLGIEIKPWEGWSRSDASFLSNMFTEQNRINENRGTSVPRANDFSLCPVCIRPVERPAGCMHMYHDCKGQPGFYHKRLYGMYKAEGKIHWCTICNRIGFAKGTQFQHYYLGLASEPVPGTAGVSYVFDNDCRERSGGGGLPEKYNRFNTLRNIAFTFNTDEHIGKTPMREVLETLTEAMWDAPIVDPFGAHHYAQRMFTRPNTNYPLMETVTNTGNTNVPTPNYVVDPIIHPVETEQWENATVISDKNIIQFIHPGFPHDRRGQQISREGLAGWLSVALGNPGSESFGYCWLYMPQADRAHATAEELANLCEAKLWPSEVRIALGLSEEPTEGENAEYRKLYEGYRKQFNRRERGTQ
jgi:ankyrin repeat protein